MTVQAKLQPKFLTVAENTLKDGKILTRCRIHKTKRTNESERVTVKNTRDFAVQQSEDLWSEDNIADCEKEMRVLFHAASLLRMAIKRSKSWRFTRSFEDSCVCVCVCVWQDYLKKHRIWQD